MSPARHLPSPVGPFQLQTLARAEALTAEPFVGITSDGHVVPELFSLEQTGVSTGALRDAAAAWLRSLNPDQRTAAIFAIDSPEWQRWNNTHPFIMRHGVLIESLTPEQRDLALEVVRASLSVRGFETSRAIMHLNETIGEITGCWDEYGEWLYWLSIFGTPSEHEPWGWQIDGHHLNLNCLVLGDQVVMTPMFMGSEPTHALSGKYAGTRVFDAEEQVALDFMRNLSAAQQDAAIVSRTHRLADVPEGQPRPVEGRMYAQALSDNLQLAYEGLRADRLTAAQQEQLLGVIDVYIGRMRAGHDRVRMAEVARHLDQTRVAWFGGIEPDSTFYYRIHSPVVLIEFDHLRGIALDNDEPARTHIHTIVRTPNGNDYGKDLLRQHYAHSPHPH